MTTIVLYTRLMTFNIYVSLSKISEINRNWLGRRLSHYFGASRRSYYVNGLRAMSVSLFSAFQVYVFLLLAIQ